MILFVYNKTKQEILCRGGVDVGQKKGRKGNWEGSSDHPSHGNFERRAHTGERSEFSAS